jgi:hypothetical protein
MNWFLKLIPTCLLLCKGTSGYTEILRSCPVVRYFRVPGRMQEASFAILHSRFIFISIGKNAGVHNGL